MRPYADLSPDQLLKMKDENKSNGGMVALINNELCQRELENNIKKLTKPHWTLTPTFWLVLITGILTLISTTILVFQFWKSFPQEKKSDPNTRPVQTNSPKLGPTEKQQQSKSQQTTSLEKKKSFGATK